MNNYLKKISIIRGCLVQGLQIIITPNGTYKMHFIKILNRVSRIVVKEYCIDIDSFNAIKPHLSIISPFVLCIDGKGVIHKFFKNIEEPSTIEMVLPNATLDEFYLQNEIVTNGVYVSVIRLSTITDILNKLKDLGLIPSLIYLGPFVLSKLTTPPCLNLINNEFSSMAFVLNQLDYIQINSSFEFRINSEEIGVPIPLLPVFALCICYYANIEFKQPQSIKNHSFLYKRMSFLLARFLFFFIISIIIVNFFLYRYLSMKNGEYEVTMQQQINKINLAKELKMNYEKKLKLLNNSGMLYSSKMSYYADRIALSVPEHLSLLIMDINPAPLKIKQGKPIEYSENQIVVSGQCDSPSSFNAFEKRLKQELWVSEIIINKFSQTSKAKITSFSIIIIIKC